MWNRALATVSCAFCRANSTTQIQSCSKRDIFYHFYVKTSSCYSLMQILLDLIFQKHSEHVSFLTLFMWNWALATVWCTFCQPRLPKSVPNMSVFFLYFYLKPSSRAHFADLPKVLRTWQFSTFSNANLQIEVSLQSCALFVHNFCRSRPGTPETKTLLRRPRKPLHPQKTHGFAPEMNSGIPRCYFPTTWWWCGWHDAVVDMMVRMLAMTIVCNSEVF